MRPDNLIRRTPVRLAMAFAVLVIGAYLLAAALAYGLMREQLTQRQDERISEVFGLLSVNADQGGDQDLVEAVSAQIAAAKDGTTLFSLRDANGAVLASNIPAVTIAPGWSDQPPQVFGRPGDVRFRVHVAPVGSDMLLVGKNYSEIDALRETILVAMLWSSFFAIIVALGGGTLIAMRVRRRLTDIERTMDRVAEGDLAARLPLSGADDDIDRVARQVNAALTRLAELVEGMRQVSSDIAHDLRTPLNRLRMRLAEAAQQAEHGVDTGPLLEAAIIESDAISETFSALLRIAQIEAGARRERFRTVDLAEVVKDVAEVYADVAEDAGMTLFHDPGTAPILIRGDRELLTQTFANLIENAIRHCPKGSRIRCGVSLEDGNPVARVIDDGPGIPEAEHHNVLRRLYRLERSRTKSGSGLGLSLVKAVADLHGAKLTLADANPGLAVSLSFPKAPGE